MRHTGKNNMKFLYLFAIFNIKTTKSEPRTPWVPFDTHFHLATKAYQKHDWKNAEKSFKNMILSYSSYKSALNYCQFGDQNHNFKGCQISVISKKFPNYINCEANSIGTADNLVSAVTLKKSECFQKCLMHKLNLNNKEELENFYHWHPNILHNLGTGQAFDYLQYIYSNLEPSEGTLLEKELLGLAVQSAYAFYKINPKDKRAKRNLEYYQKNYAENNLYGDNLHFPELAIDDSNKFLFSFNSAMEFYDLAEEKKDNDNKKLYFETIRLLEKTLDEWLLANKICRSKCAVSDFPIGTEYGYGYNDPPPNLPIFEEILTMQWVHILQCQVNCTNNIAKYPGETNHEKNFIPQIFHYLQYCYGIVNKMDLAVEAANTYMLFDSKDQAIKANLLIYQRQMGGKNRAGKTRDVWVEFLKTLRVELAYLKRAKSIGFSQISKEIFDVFPKDEIKEEEEAKNFPKDDHINGQEFGKYVLEHPTKSITIKKSAKPLIETDDNHQLPEKFKNKILNPFTENPSSKINWIGPKDTIPKLIADNTIFKHHNSLLVLDDIITNTDCEALLELARVVVKAGDGYDGLKKPHNLNEVFYGATLSEVADYVNKKIIDPTYLYIYYYLAERVRRQIQMYNNLDELYQDYVHLVCRDVEEDKVVDEETYQKELRDWLEEKHPKGPRWRKSSQLSHPIHSDNCSLHYNGTCARKAPAYTWREHSAVVYLHGNEDFTGGELVFLDNSGQKVIANVEPKCGRMAAFCAGKDCIHGVKGVRKGKRCALAQWFTLDYSRRDSEHLKVLDILKRFKHKISPDKDLDL